MLPFASSWQEMIATLPPGERAEFVAVLLGHAEDGSGDAEDDGTT